MTLDRRIDDDWRSRVEGRHDDLVNHVSMIAQGLAAHVAACNATGETVVSRLGRLEAVVISAVLLILSGLGTALGYVLTHSIHLVVAP